MMVSAYRAGLAIFERLAAADPSNAGWQRDLFASYAKLGSVEERRQSRQHAATNYSAAEEIIRRLAPSDLSNVQWQQDLAWIEERLAAVSEASPSESQQNSGRWSRFWNRLKR
jgi:hypothetical protein